MKKYHYHIFPPYIDAYLTSGIFYIEKEETLKEIKSKMELHALAWGEQSIGKAILKMDEPAKKLHKGRDWWVVCCAYVWDVSNSIKTTGTTYLVLVDAGSKWEDTMEIIEADIEDCWDVT